MKILTSLIAVGCVAGAFHYFNAHQAAHAVQKLLHDSDANGFVDVPLPAGQRSDTVYVIAAQNCPKEAARQADHLANELAREGIPALRTNQVQFQSRQMDHATMDRLSALMGGPLPLVFVHGRAAPNPGLDQVVAEYAAVSRRSPQ